MLRTVSLLTLAVSGIFAQNVCRNGIFADDQDNLRLARVSGAGDAALYQDTSAGCPEKGAECRKAESLTSGSEVVVSKNRGIFACVWKSHEAVGWTAASGLDFSARLDRTPPAAAWAGDWKFFDNHLVLAVSTYGKGLRVSGHAFWHGIGSTHQGDAEGVALPAGNRVIFKEGSCELRLTLLGQRLAASDNRRCGGANVTFTGVYQRAPAQFQAQSSSTVHYGHNADGQETVDITNVSFELAQTANERLILRKTHTENNVIDDMGNDPKIMVEAWPLGVNPKEPPLYRVSMDGEDAAVIDQALLVFDRSQEAGWWSVYHLDSGRHFFDTNAPLLRFSLTEPEQTERYGGLEIASDDTADKRLKAKNVIGVLTYASQDRVIREALITCDNAERARILRSLADSTFELSATGKTIRLLLAPFQSAPAEITIPVVNDDLDLAHAHVPPGMHLTAGQR